MLRSRDTESFSAAVGEATSSLNARNQSACVQAPGRKTLKIAMLAPPWIPIPPPAYGGVESVVAVLCDQLSRRGHSVTLFAAPGSESSAEIRTPLSKADEHFMGMAIGESDHVARAFAEVDAAAAEGMPFDLVHDHCGATAIAMADRLHTPMVHTLHNPVTGAFADLYEHHGHKVCTVALSRSQLRSAPAAMRSSPVIPNPIDVDNWPFRRAKDDYLLWIGRMAPCKGPQRAIEVARLASRPLVLAGPVQTPDRAFFEAEVRPHIDGNDVSYIGSVGGSVKADLFARAAALLMPIRWPEPFGMVMIEALACGTPVLAFRQGAAEEIVIDQENGFLVADEGEMADAVGQLESIDPAACRLSASGRYDGALVAAAYERVYFDLAAPRPLPLSSDLRPRRRAAAHRGLGRRNLLSHDLVVDGQERRTT